MQVLGAFAFRHDLRILSIGIGNDERIAQGPTGPDEHDSLAVRGPLQGVFILPKGPTRFAAQRRRNHPGHGSLPLILPLCHERDLGSVRRYIQPSDAVVRLHDDVRRRGEIGGVAPGDELDPHSVGPRAFDR